MKIFTAIFSLLISGSSIAQEGFYFFSTHDFNQYWKKYNADRSDSSVCNFEFKWIAFQGTHPLVQVLTKEAAALACIPFNDSCAGDSITETWADRQSKYFKEIWLEGLEDTSNADVSHEFYGDISAVENDTFISLLMNMAVYSGGAHPSTYSNYVVINRSDQQRIHSWQSLFTDTAAILRLGAIAFREEYELMHNTDDDSAWFQNFFLPQNFYFDSVGMHFIYRRGDIAPPSYGPASLSFPYEKIDGMARVRLH